MGEIQQILMENQSNIRFHLNRVIILIRFHKLSIVMRLYYVLKN